MDQEDFVRRMRDEFDIPQICWNELPTAEQDHARVIQRQFHELSDHVRRFKAALELFDFSRGRVSEVQAAHNALPSTAPITPAARMEARRRLRTAAASPSIWIHIAARDGAITIDAFHQTLINIRQARDKSVALKSMLAGRNIESVLEHFNRYFPNAEDVRNGLTHVSDLAGSSKKMTMNAYSGGYDADGLTIGPDSSNNLISGVRDRKIFVTIQKKVLAFDMSEETLNKLRELRRELFEAFAPVETATKQLLRNRTNLQRPKDTPGDSE